MQSRFISWLRNNLALIPLLIAVFIIYSASLKGDFVIDDIPLVRDNPYTRDISHITRFFTRGVWENSAQEILNEPLYRPMQLVPMLLGHSLWGSNPVGYHAFLLLLHLANTCLVYALIRKVVNGSAMAATIGAAMFALHPAKVESVAWIIGGIDPLVAFFLMGSMLVHRLFVDSLKDKPDGRYGLKEWLYLGLSLACFQLALWSKEVAFVFPLVVVAHDLIYRRKIHWPVVFLHAVVVVCYLIARSLVLSKAGQLSALDLSQLPRMTDFVLGYSEMLVLPTHIPFYIQPPEHSVSSIMGMVSVVIIVLLAGFSWRFFGSDRRRDLAFAFVWIVGFIWPAILLALYTSGFYAGRYLYIPSAGIAVFVAVLYDFIHAAYPRFITAAMASCAMIIAFYGFVIWKEIPVWHDGGTIYGKIVGESPENAVGYLGLGYFHFNRGDYAAAESDFLLALQKAKVLQYRVEALVVLGTINGINNNLDKSEFYLREVVKLDPNNSDGWSGLGNLAWLRGRLDDAIYSYEKALFIRPNYYEAAMNLAAAYDKTGQSQRGDVMRQKAAAMSH
jgi:Tfp pilus assembly protein PilF